MADTSVTKILNRKLGTKNSYAKVFLAEFLGTFILIIFGDGSVAQMVFGGAASDYYSVIWGYSLAVTFGILVSGGVSGGHINPAVTLAFALWGKTPWSKVPVYMIAQYLGAFVASLVLYYEYADALVLFEQNRSTLTAGIWATYPGKMADASGVTMEYLTSSNGLYDQVLGTALLLIAVCAITDERNSKIPSHLTALLIGFAVMNIGLSFGINAGFAINPARDLAPRIFTMLWGWGDIPFTTTTIDDVVYWWIPIAGPHIGAILGVVVYTFFIEMHHDPDEAQERPAENAPALLVKSERG